MATTDTVFTGSIPSIYDGCMVPLLFEPYAEIVAERAGTVAIVMELVDEAQRVAMREHHALGMAGGAGRVQDRGRLLRVDALPAPVDLRLD